MSKKAPIDKSASSFDFMGFGTRFCARNAGVDFSYLYIATKWMTIFVPPFWPLGTLSYNGSVQAARGCPPWAATLAHIAVLQRLRPADGDHPVARPGAGELCKKKSGATLGAAQPTDKVHG